MKNRALFSLVAAALAAAGCSVLQEGLPGPNGVATSKDCGNGVQCDIIVHVASCTKAGFTFSVDEMHVKTRNETITWRIAEPGYIFDPVDGVSFKYAHAEFHGQSANGNQFTWQDSNNLTTGPGRKYPYSVKILNSNGSFCVIKDPIIINDA